ncbi:MAG: 3-hydroxyacyl-CoA dehydrogenase NAD-binding domain-containing protein, partial [Gemmatimonadetes bacterium]|nr:3-hydroxyacyl-CoA dehydrogenase NAD-binding domain-containing protein [Gemmatimonadota bacterium]
PDTFIAGADIDEFVRLRSSDEALQLIRSGQQLVNRFEQLDKPVVAAIHGACLGAGLETALACTYRVATDHRKTQLGFPEVSLGIIPAAGGCQRLPRLIGVPAALGIILAPPGRFVPARRAHRLGMVDELVHPSMLEQIAVRAAVKLADGWKPRRSHGGLTAAILQKTPIGRWVVFSKAAKEVKKKTGGYYPAPMAALDAVQHGLTYGVEAGLDREARHFTELGVGDVSRKLIQIFFADTALRKDPGVDGPVTEAGGIKNLVVAGAGFMGAAIGGTAALRAGVDVRLRDTNLERVSNGMRVARAIVRERLERKRMTRYEYRRIDALLSGGADWAGLGRADLVIEAVFEDLDVKQQVFRELEAVVSESCILASNTSTIPIARIAEATRHPGRVIGMHFFSPVQKMPLLEIIVTDQTEPRTTVTSVNFGRRMGKTVIVVRDHPGFWVNRILSPYLNEAGRMVKEGVAIEDIDRIMKHFGFPVGPITLLDEVGLDVAQKGSIVMHSAYGDRMTPMDGLGRMIDAGRLGRKTKRGFYRYKRGKRKEVDRSVYELFGEDPRPVPNADIEKRLVYAMLNEAARAVEEGIVRSPRDGDIGAVYGIGYPPFRGGPLRQLDEVGAARIVDTLERLAQAYGDRFAPAPVLLQMAKSNLRFYPTN